MHESLPLACLPRRSSLCPVLLPSQSMLCGMGFGVFLFFAVWVIIMTIFVAVLIPETKVRGVWMC